MRAPRGACCASSKRGTSPAASPDRAAIEGAVVVGWLGRNLRRWAFNTGAYASALLGMSAIALVWCATVYFSLGASDEAERAAYKSANNLSAAFAEQLIRSIRAVDQTLLYVRDKYAHDPKGFDISLWSQDRAFLTGFNFQVVIIGRDGRMVASNIPGSKPGLDLSDREHFRVHVSRSTDELFISKPVLGRVSKKWSVQLTRRIVMPDGSFGGVAVASISPDYLSRFYGSIDVGQRGVVTLVGTDGIVRARGARADENAFIGMSLADSDLFRRLARSASGTYESRSRLDGIDRLFAYRTVRDLPLVVAVGLAKDEVFKAAVDDRDKGLIVAAALTLWLAGIMVLMLRYERALRRSRDAAEAGTRARTEFLAMMSHEIRTPMNGVVGMSEVLMESGLSAEQLGFARTLRKSADHLLRLINDVLDFSKLDAGRVEIERIGFDLHDLVASNTEILAPTAAEKGLILRHVIAANVPQRVIGDPARLRQVLFNLVGNGLKFTTEGSVTVAVDVDHTAMMPGHVRLAFAVSDTGIGIPKDGLPLMFKEFSQLDSSIARRFGGTGLGLAICRRLVTLMGGAISVESEAGKGATFRFTIDCRIDKAAQAQPVATAATVSPPVLAAPRDLRILVVEDNKTNQQVALALLARLGYTPDIANDGAEALTACSTHSYDVVFMDVMMPGMDGPSATRAIRELPAPFGSCHIIALTANASPADQISCRDAGMDGFLAKPVTRAGLAAQLDAFLAKAPVVAAAPPLAPDIDSDRPAFDMAVYGELLDAIGPDGMVQVLCAFLSDMPERLSRMRRAAEAGNAAPVEIEAHAIKSSSASIGFTALSAVAKALEQNSPTLAPAALAARIADVADAFAAIDHLGRSELRALLQTDNKKETANV
ncbi:MAG: response regulator [Proteobacteria bacterium]|nr:response regulator [Pseudomonadota bacterium]